MQVELLLPVVDEHRRDLPAYRSIPTTASIISSSSTPPLPHDPEPPEPPVEDDPHSPIIDPREAPSCLADRRRGRSDFLSAEVTPIRKGLFFHTPGSIKGIPSTDHGSCCKPLMRKRQPGRPDTAEEVAGGPAPERVPRPDTSDPANDRRPFSGLALSGGGFRAAFFHIGVLARLAELDLLRHVTAISTVSGGSIVGALYYLKVKAYLEANANGSEPDRSAYVTIVQELCDEFLAGARHDLRSRTFAHYRSTRQARNSERIGDLYDDHFYCRYRPDPARKIRMRDLRVSPELAGANPTGRPPRLFINATVLDTGQRWIFTPESMGALPADGGDSPLREILAFDKEVGGHPRQYEDLELIQDPIEKVPDASALKDFPLGRAVAASACVPLVFPPVRMPLYPFGPEELEQMARKAAAERDHDPTAVKPELRKLHFELVDGGVVDNLGLGPLSRDLFDRGDEAGRVLVSNGSAPAALGLRRGRPSSFATVGRSLRVLLQKTQQAADLQALSSLGEDKMEVSLAAAFDDSNGEKEPVSELVELLNDVRTDLDAFTDWEGHALMYAGYVSAFRLVGAPSPTVEVEWPFEWIGAQLDRTEILKRQLGASSSPFKLARLAPLWVREYAWLLALFFVLAVVFVTMQQVDSELGVFSTPGNAVYFGTSSVAVLSFVLWKWGLSFATSLALSVISGVSLLLRPWLLRRGSRPAGREKQNS